ncbi:hypothetical protein RND15_50865, partial [Streptomyces sp. DSM 41529]|nr:hypothetical protein [Streptomyces sp. DSM 41529]
MSLQERLASQAVRYREAYVSMYGDIFGITAIVCVVGAVLGLLIAARHVHVDEPAGPPEDLRAGQSDDTSTGQLYLPTEVLPVQSADPAVQGTDQPPGRHRSS